VKILSQKCSQKFARACQRRVDASDLTDDRNSSKKGKSDNSVGGSANQCVFLCTMGLNVENFDIVLNTKDSQMLIRMI
jgi:hypothetical protein